MSTMPIGGKTIGLFIRETDGGGGDDVPRSPESAYAVPVMKFRYGRGVN